MLLQLVIATALSAAGVAAVVESTRPAIDAAHAWTCSSARDTVELAAVAHLAATGRPPASLHDLTAGARPELVLPVHAQLSVDGSQLVIDGWTVELGADGAVAARCDAAG